MPLVGHEAPPTKLPPSATVAGLDGRVKPAGKVTVTVSPVARAPLAEVVKCAVQFVLAVFATVLVLVKLTAVTEVVGAVMVALAKPAVSGAAATLKVE